MSRQVAYDKEGKAGLKKFLKIKPACRPATTERGNGKDNQPGGEEE